MKIDRDGIAAATGLGCSRVHSGLCTHQLGDAAKAMKEGPVVIACQQEAQVFEDLAEELDLDPPACIDLRDRAGWSDATATAPKMAALLAAGLHRPEPSRTIDIDSQGVCLVIGAAEVVLPVAEELSEVLAVTCLVPQGSDPIPAPRRRFDIHQGRLRAARGSFGKFSVTVDALAMMEPSGRGTLRFGAPRDGGRSDCDIILDLSGGAPLFPAAHKRDGYLRADPGDPVMVARVAGQAALLTGTFEKTLHVRTDPSLCAHARAQKSGCTRCLDLCPAGAILPDGDHVTVDAEVCAGCGACSAVCPSGAISLDDPPVAHVFQQIRILAETYRAAGGCAPRLLVHDAEHGREMIALAARFGTGLPGDVLPLEITALAGFGHAEILAAFGVGFVEVALLVGPRSERAAIEAQIQLARAMLTGLGRAEGGLRLLDPDDPDGLCDLLASAPQGTALQTPILPQGGRRDVTRLAARALRTEGSDPVIPLPAGAPYGAVQVDTDACTLCLACTGLCPSGALGDHPDTPQLSFREDACLQCGTCATICPERAITLVPQFDLSDAALSERVLKHEEPYCCISCGAAFGVKSTIERIVAKLEGQHAMFTGSDNARLIRMCDDCRVKAQYHSQAAPFAAAPRPRVRTTEDYLRARDETED